MTSLGGITRRGLLVGGVAGAVLGSGLAPRAASAQARTDDEILASSVALELIAAFVYGQIADRGGLAGDPAVARTFARQEREHAAALIRVLSDRGGSAPAAPRQVRDVPGLERALDGGARSRTGLAIQIEQVAVSAYYAAQAKIQDLELLRTTASIMASEAQHLVVLRSALGHDPAPDAFVTGRRG